jgi:hypothetical protein
MSAGGRDPEALWVGFGLVFGNDTQLSGMRCQAGDTADREPVRTPAEAAALIQRYQALGVTCISAGLPRQKAKELIAGLRWFADEVIPLATGGS